ncbi:hypothetical protein PF66_06376 [Pseudomonas asplenii]|uniref:Uncharacterized protein n=1 Tax=Pseudomonas asplenii TaxID=53407 RepID=A0A0N0VIB8_9PSED|nr:hypothetical protein [Pseudomonas fuscovaginae]KPA87031.1 hypothetical protein PF66_06376 [Pseudomonas fuscovaginae]
MAMDQAERDRRRRTKSTERQEEDLRLKVRPGTKQALSDLMAWAGLTEQGEAMTLMIHHLHSLGPSGALPFLTPPRHEITVSNSVALKLENFCRREALRISQEEIA